MGLGRREKRPDPAPRRSRPGGHGRLRRLRHAVLHPLLCGSNVKSVPYSCDGATFSLGSPAGVATTNGADGVIFAPDGDLLVGRQGDQVHKVDPTNGHVTTVSAGGTQSYHLALDISGQKFWSAGIPGALAEVPLNPFGNGVYRPLSGDDTAITSIAFYNSGNYTAQDNILSAFQNEVTAQDGKWVTHADVLTQMAEALKS